MPTATSNSGAMRVLISGASGFIGSALVPSLESGGAEITRLSRGESGANTTTKTTIPWDPAMPIAPEAVSGFDAVIHLAGESIVGRWTTSKKEKIRDSRVISTRNLAQALAKAKAKAKDKPKVFICGSAIGYYGDRGGELLNERSNPGTGFLPDVCRQWEAATQPAADAGIRTVQIRTGIVLSSQGGALAKMLTPFKMGVGGRIGDGRQWMSWIDLEDMVAAILHVLNSDSVRGPVNMVAPNPVTNSDFTKTLAALLSRPAIFPMPAFAVKLAFGEMGETVLLGSQRVEPAQLVRGGYAFRFIDLHASLQNLLKS